MSEKGKTAATKSETPAAPNSLRVEATPGKSRERLLAEVGQSPLVRNAETARRFAKGAFGELDLEESVHELRSKTAQVHSGDLTGLEAILAAQATALDSIFNEMARRAALNMGEYLNATDTFMRLALKAQGQCRATLETLAEIKNPRAVAFVKQANIAHGPQQVNNGLPAKDAVARAENPANGSNKLLEANSGERLDTGAARAAGRANRELETVGAVDRP